MGIAQKKVGLTKYPTHEHVGPIREPLRNFQKLPTLSIHAHFEIDIL